MKDKLIRLFFEVVGTSVASFVLRICIAVILFAFGGVSDLGQLTGIIIDKDKAITQAVVLLNETPNPEIVEAVQEKKPAEVPVTVEVIPLVESQPTPPAE